MIYRRPSRTAVLSALMETWAIRRHCPTRDLVMDIRVAKKGKVEDATFTFPFCRN